MMNPLKLMELRRMKNTIGKNHPKLFPFLLGQCYFIPDKLRFSYLLP